MYVAKVSVPIKKYDAIMKLSSNFSVVKYQYSLDGAEFQSCKCTCTYINIMKYVCTYVC